jgi:multidrug efflux pump subunit AcrA (membrane-fusion protein)
MLAAQPAGASAATDKSVVRLPTCLVSLIDDVDLPAQEAGVLKELIAKPGLQAKAGDVLGKVDETETLVRQKAAKFKLDVAIEKATNTAQVELSKKVIEVYKAEYEESLAINERSAGAIPPTQLRKQRVYWEKGVADYIAAEMEFKIAGLERNVQEAELEAADNELKQRTLVAPFDGVVEEIFRQQNEWVQPGDPVLRFVRMNRLRVEGFVSGEIAAGQVDGATVEINVVLPGGATEKLKGQISFVSTKVGANKEEYRVWAEVDNLPGRDGYPWLLRPGVRPEMIIHLNR